MLRYKGLPGLIFAIAMLLAPLARAQEQQEVDSHARIVRLSYVEGDVQLAGGRDFGFENATLNTPLSERDQVRTGPDGRAEIQFEDGSTIRLAPETQITFSELGRFSSGATVTSVDLDAGEAEFRVARHGDDDVFAVHARQRVIELTHSSLFRVTNTNSDPLEIAVWKGEVKLSDPDSGSQVAVKQNETFTLDALDSDRYGLQKGAEEDYLDDWSSEREDYLSRYATPTNANYSQSPYQYGMSDLNYYGQFYNLPGYGYLWRPNNVNLGWDPFMNGYWNYSPQFGYMWVSSYPWGWMPYRYGHWVFLNGYGWLWQPGNFSGGWHRFPGLVNAPHGFRAPLPPAVGARTAGSGQNSGRPAIGFPGNTPGRNNSGQNGDRAAGDRLRHGRVITNDDFPGRADSDNRRPAVTGRPEPGDVQDRRAGTEHEGSSAMRTEQAAPAQPQQTPDRDIRDRRTGTQHEAAPAARTQQMNPAQEEPAQVRDRRTGPQHEASSAARTQHIPESQPLPENWPELDNRPEQQNFPAQQPRPSVREPNIPPSHQSSSAPAHTFTPPAAEHTAPARTFTPPASSSAPARSYSPPAPSTPARSYSPPPSAAPRNEPPSRPK
jgi:hypothetical protein